MLTPEQIWQICKRKHYSTAYADYWESHRVCEAGCRRGSSPPHHIRTRGAGGDDAAVNLLALCVEDHNYIHAMGAKRFVTRYPHLAGKIVSALGRSKVPKGT